jgi:hypothetical protein
MPNGIFIDSDTLTPNLKGMGEKLDRRMKQLTGYYAERGQNQMRQNAPWTDRTSNARNGLFGKETSDAAKYRITYYGTVPYQIFLEVRWDGKYSIIVPTVKKMGAELMHGVINLVEHLK